MANQLVKSSCIVTIWSVKIQNLFQEKVFVFNTETSYKLPSHYQSAKLNNQYSGIRNKIIQYPPQFLEKITIAQEKLNDVQITNLVQEQINQLLKYQTLIKQIQRIYKLILNILQEIIPDNVTMSLITSKYLQQPIDKTIQSVIQMHHVHGLNTFQPTQISPEQQMCDCTILELYVKFNVFFCQVIPSEEKDLSKTFCELYVDEQFKAYFCRQIIKYFHLFYKPIHRYKFVTKDNSINININ